MHSEDQISDILRNMQPLKKVGAPEDIGWMVAYLVT